MASQTNDSETTSTNQSESSSDKLKEAIKPAGVDKPKPPNTPI